MNTRSFLKSLALLGAAAAGCPGVFIPKFEPVRWKAMRFIPNPDYVDAPYEARLLCGNWHWFVEHLEGGVFPRNAGDPVPNGAILFKRCNGRSVVVPNLAAPKPYNFTK